MSHVFQPLSANIDVCQDRYDSKASEYNQNPALTVLTAVCPSCQPNEQERNSGRQTESAAIERIAMGIGSWAGVRW